MAAAEFDDSFLESDLSEDEILSDTDFSDVSPVQSAIVSALNGQTNSAGLACEEGTFKGQESPSRKENCNKSAKRINECPEAQGLQGKENC